MPHEENGIFRPIYARISHGQQIPSLSLPRRCATPEIDSLSLSLPVRGEGVLQIVGIAWTDPVECERSRASIVSLTGSCDSWNIPSVCCRRPR